MSAGLNLTGRIIRFTASSNDDIVGGAVPSGTIVYSNVYARIETEEPTLALLEQGLETPIIFSALISPGNLVINHNDQLEITSPTMSPFYNEKFRVIGVQNSSTFDPRAFIILTLRRIVEAHSNVLQ